MKRICKVGTLAGIEVDFDLEISTIKDSIGSKRKNLELILKSIYLLKSNLPYKIGSHYEILDALEKEVNLRIIIENSINNNIPLEYIWKIGGRI